MKTFSAHTSLGTLAGLVLALSCHAEGPADPGVSAAGSAGAPNAGSGNTGNMFEGINEGGSSSGGALNQPPVELVSFDNFMDGGVAGTGGSELPNVDFSYQRPDPSDAGGCAAVEAQATLQTLPVDIVFVIDNSGSMSEEIQEVEAQINDSFAGIIAASGLDYRVIMVSRYGDVDRTPTPDLGDSNFPICIRSPLSAYDCSDPHNTQLVNNPPQFFHYSADVKSRNAWCMLQQGLTSSDELILGGGTLGTRPFTWAPVAPQGYAEFLREEATKSFVVISDDAPGADGCSAYADSQAGAQAFDQALRQALPAQFGAYDALAPDQDRKYRWYSIVGFDGTGLTVPLAPSAPVATGMCNVNGNTGVRPGTGYQELSIMTGGLRFPSCQTDDYSSVFNDIAQGVIQGAQISCEFDVPAVSGLIDPDQVNVEYLAGGDPGQSVPLTRASNDDVANCANEQFVLTDYVGGEPTKIVLCPQACDLVQGDADALINIDFGCLGS